MSTQKTSAYQSRGPAFPALGYVNDHPLYPIWQSMKQRCENPNHPRYHRYGGRGVTVCDRWQSFPCFVEDMGKAPEGHSLERRENDKGYEPGNCKWATYTEQNRNRSNVKKINYNGESVTIPELSEITGIPLNVLRQRIVRRGWDIERAVSTDPSLHFNSKTKQGA